MKTSSSPFNRLSKVSRYLGLCFFAAALPKVNGEVAATNPAGAEDQPDTLKLTPFEVTASSNVGYGASTTSSSGRVVQAYIDVPQSVNVVTAKFLQDFNIDNSRDALATVPGVLLGGQINNGSNMIRGVSVNAFYVNGLQGSAGSTALSTGGAGGSMVMPTVFYDRIEVVKGPSSAAFGVGESGGIINYIPKTPQGINRAEVTVGIGTYNNYIGSIDVQRNASDKLSYRLLLDYESGDSSVKFVHRSAAAAQMAFKYRLDSATTVQWITSFARFETPASNPVPQFHNGTQAEAYAIIPVPGFTYNPASYPTTGGVPVGLPFGFIANNNPAMPDWWNSDVNQAFRTEINLVHDFRENISVRNALAFDYSSQKQHIVTGPLGALKPYNPDGVSTVGLNPGEYGYAVQLLDWPIRSHGIRDALDFTATWEALGGHWTTTAGGEAYQTWNWQDFQIGYLKNKLAQFLFVNPYNPGNLGDVNQYINAYGHDKTFFIQGPWDKETTKGYGYYVQQQVSFWNERLTLLGAWRQDFLSQSDTAIPSGVVTATGWNHNQGSPRFAVTVKPVKWLSLYSLYSQHNDPVKQASRWIVAGSGIPSSIIANPKEFLNYTPKGDLYEQGIKSSFFNGRLTASAAYFQDKTSGTLLTIPNVYVPTTGPDAGVPQRYSEVTNTGTDIHGVELSVTGAFSNGLTFAANYARTRGTQPAILQGTSRDGAYIIPVVNAIQPPDVANVFGKYDFGRSKDQGLYVTFGVNAFSPFIIQPNLVDWAGKLWTFKNKNWQYQTNAGLGYRWDRGKQKVALSCNNLTDQYVYLGGSGSGNAADMAGRQVWLKYTLTY